jgi:hypothetical protein
MRKGSHLRRNISINPGPFDLLAWPLLWVSGLFCGQRLYEKKRALPLQTQVPLADYRRLIASLLKRLREKPLVGRQRTERK